MNLIEYTANLGLAKSMGKMLNNPIVDTITTGYDVYSGSKAYINPKYEVSYEVNGIKQSKSIRSKSGLDAIQSIKRKYPNAINIKSTRI